VNRDGVIVRPRRGYTLVFDTQTHTYTLQKGLQVYLLPSVTRVLSIIAKPKVSAWAMDLMAQHILDNYSPGMSLEEMALLTQEARGAHLQESRRTAGAGSEVHRWIEAFLREEPRELPEDPSSLKAIRAFIEWWREEKRREVLLAEEIVAHPELLYAGKIDLLLADGTLVDFKTSKALYPEHELQLGGYALALEAWEGILAPKGPPGAHREGRQRGDQGSGPRGRQGALPVRPRPLQVSGEGAAVRPRKGARRRG
jgi:hypothetical protein